MAHLVFIGGNVLAFFASWALARMLVPQANATERGVLVLAGLPIVVVPVLTLLGIAGMLFSGPALVAVAALAAGLWLRVRSRRTPQDELEPTRTASGSGAAAVAVTGAIAGAAAVGAWDMGAAHLLEAHKYHWDDFSYHGPMPAHWVQWGRLGLAPFNYHAYYPGNGELFAAWFLLPTHELAHAALAGLFWMMLGAAAVVHLSRCLDAGAAGAAAALLLFVLAEPFDHQARSFAAVDLGGAALAAAAVAVACSRGPQGASDAVFSRVFYVGALMGLAIGCKVTHAPIAVLTLVWLLWDRRVGPGQALRAAGLFAAACLLWGGVWYVRNLWLAGNPVFPAQFLFFDGPLDTESQRPTSLLYQWLNELRPGQKQAALDELLDWPKPVAYLMLGGYALSAAALLWPRWWRDPVARRRALVVIGGVLMLAVIAAGPFSGTANAKFAKLQIRLRFFLPVAILAIPLAAHWLGRGGRAGVLLPAAAAVWLLVSGDPPWQGLGWAAAAGAALALAARRWAHLRPRGRAGSLLAVVALALTLVGVDRALVTKQQEVYAMLREDRNSWSLLKQVPDGARVTWFGSHQAYKYFFVFGPRLEHVPVVPWRDGSPWPFMHEDWRDYRPTWWNRRRRPRNTGQLVPNLQAQGVDYVLVTRRRQDRWPGYDGRLKKSDAAVQIDRRSTAALYRLAPGKP